MSATRRLRDDGAIDAAGDEQPERLDHDYLVSLKDIGPYAAAHCRLLLRDFSHIPVDSAVVANLRERHGCGPAEFAASRSSIPGTRLQAHPAAGKAHTSGMSTA